MTRGRQVEKCSIKCVTRIVLPTFENATSFTPVESSPFPVLKKKDQIKKGKKNLITD
jgi:hypothetical protein